MNTYKLSRAFFEWAYDHSLQVKPIHVALYFFILDRANYFGWPDNFGLPSDFAGKAIGVKKSRTVSDHLKDLIDWGFIALHEKSINQYTANVISVCASPSNGKAEVKALGKADVKATAKQGAKQRPYNKTDKPKTKKLPNEFADEMFEYFWKNFDNKQGKEKARQAWAKMTEDEMKAAIPAAKAYKSWFDGYKKVRPDATQKMAQGWLNDKRWNDEIPGFTRPTTEYTKILDLLANHPNVVADNWIGRFCFAGINPDDLQACQKWCIENEIGSGEARVMRDSVTTWLRRQGVIA